MRNRFLIIPTIDAEGVHGERPFEQMMLGEVGELEPWGIELQAKIFHARGIAATFFVDIYEHSFYGEKALAGVVETLLRYEQDVQLHTHPAWFEDERDFDFINEMKRTSSAYDPSRYWMWQYSLEEQVDILGHGIEKLIQWGAPRPVAHRAGAYGINEDTIEALRQVEIPVDSSMFHTHTNCKTTWSINTICERDGILELPVTGFERRQRIGLGPMSIPHKTSFVKTDVDWCTLDELNEFVDLAKDLHLPYMNLFLHSYTLLKRSPKFHTIAAAPMQRLKLEQFLDTQLQRDSVEFCSVKQLWEARDQYDFQQGDAIPAIIRAEPLHKKLTQRIKRLQK